MGRPACRWWGVAPPNIRPLPHFAGLPFREVIDLELANHPQTITALEMNGEPLSTEHGAPARLRVETQLGFKMVK